MAVIDSGNDVAGKANVDAGNNLQVALSNVPDYIGGVRAFSENDTGAKSGAPQLLSPETDLDFRLRAAQDTFYDQEIFNFSAQNTGKHSFANTTMTASYGTNGFLTNSGSITTTTTGLRLRTYAVFPVAGTSTLSLDVQGGFSAVPSANQTVDFGLFIDSGVNPYAPSDGAYFRLTSAGLFGVVNFNGTETSTPVFSFTVTTNKNYQFILYISQRSVEFWINNGDSTDLYGVIKTPDGNPQPCTSGSLPFAVRHAITGGAAGAVQQFRVGAYNVRLGGPNMTRTPGELGNACYGSYQGLSGGTMGGLASIANSSTPAAAVPSNTALTANLCAGLGGVSLETDTLAVGTDGILMSYQIPAAAVGQVGRRLRITGVVIDSVVQSTLTGGGYVAMYTLCFGHTAVSLATAEAAAAKAARRVGLGMQTVASGATAPAILTRVNMDFKDAPIYVNPGEFVQVVKRKIGTAPSAGAIQHLFTLIFSWE